MARVPTWTELLDEATKLATTQKECYQSVHSLLDCIPEFYDKIALLNKKPIPRSISLYMQQPTQHVQSSLPTRSLEEPNSREYACSQTYNPEPTLPPQSEPTRIHSTFELQRSNTASQTNDLEQSPQNYRQVSEPALEAHAHTPQPPSPHHSTVQPPRPKPQTPLPPTPQPESTQEPLYYSIPELDPQPLIQQRVESTSPHSIDQPYSMLQPYPVQSPKFKPKQKLLQNSRQQPQQQSQILLDEHRKPSSKPELNSQIPSKKQRSAQPLEQPRQQPTYSRNTNLQEFEHLTPPPLPLSEYWKQNRPELAMKANLRLNYLKRKAEKRKFIATSRALEQFKISYKNTKRPVKQESYYKSDASFMRQCSVPEYSVKCKLSEHEMKRLTAKTYKRLPEVKRRRQEEMSTHQRSQFYKNKVEYGRKLLENRKRGIINYPLRADQDDVSMCSSYEESSMNGFERAADSLGSEPLY